jgi:hypothetical protein
MTFIASMAAINYFRLVESALTSMWGPLGDYADALGLLIVFLVIFLLLQYLATKFAEENTQMNPLANAVGGAIFGGMAAMLLIGLLSISWLMLPGSAYFVGDDPKDSDVIFSADQLFLTTARFIANDRIPGSAAFDPMHNFMKVHTNKYLRAPGIGVENARPQNRRTGLSEKPDTTREDAEQP